jgi:peptidoglycan hydrolase-like protein with peptidoglycan-binding domain
VDSSSPRWWRTRRTRLAAPALLAVVVAVLAVVLLDGSEGKRPSASSGVPPGQLRTTVTRRTLSESSTVDGTLGYGASLELYDRLAGTFTWLPSVGATISRGGTLWRIDDRPVVLMYGSVPAYRTLKAGVSDGPDVTQLNRNLIDLGYDPYGAITDVETFSEATADAVRRWQKAEGLPQTGEVPLGRVVFAPGARRITTVHVTLGEDPPAASAAEGAAKEPASADREPAGEEPTDKEPSREGQTNKPAGKGKTPKRKKLKTAEEKAAAERAAKEKAAKEATKQPADDGTGADEPGDKGGGEPSGDGEDQAAGAGTAVLTTTPTRQLVQLKVKAEQQQLARLGERAPVLLPGGNSVQGRIIEVGSVASSSSADEPDKGDEPSGGEPGGADDESATIPVTLALTRGVAHLDEAPVSVELVKRVRRDVLTVPATALTATAGGGYAIEALEGTRRVALSVTPGMFADGYVQVEGADVHEGLTVIESE